MKNKPSDIKYCKVRKEIIQKVNPKLNHENLKHFYDWMSERYNIHLKKDIEKLPAPWTSNPVLLKYKFTNVRREHDRESIWLIKNICLNKELSYENKILNAILFRLINKSESLEIIGLQEFDNLNLDEVRKKIEDQIKKNPKYIWFSNAFFTSGPKSTANRLFNKSQGNMINMILLVKDYYQGAIIERIQQSKNQDQVYKTMLRLPGLGQFLAYQIFVDLTYIPEFPFSENEFVIAGPGCIKGLKYLFNNFSGLTYEESLFWLRDNKYAILKEFGYEPQELFIDLPEYDRYLNVMSLENCMCELSKYIRTITGKGRPRILYKHIM